MLVYNLLVAWDPSWWECLYHRHWKKKTNQALSSPEMVVEHIPLLFLLSPYFWKGYLYLLLNFANLKKPPRKSNGILMKQIGNLQLNITLGGGMVDGLVYESVVLRGSDEISLWGRRENSRIWGNSNTSLVPNSVVTVLNWWQISEVKIKIEAQHPWKSRSFTLW